jgi:uncharacterized membrane protein YfcA
LCSAVGAALAVAVALRLPKVWLKLGIGLIVTSMGVFILMTRRRILPFSWRRLTAIGALAAFNKGLSGGGYGPLVTGGQIVSGVDGKDAIGTTSVSEAVTCAVGLAAYLLAGRLLDWAVAIPLLIGAMASVPVSAMTVKICRQDLLRSLVGVATLGLGALTLANILFG